MCKESNKIKRKLERECKKKERELLKEKQRKEREAKKILSEVEKEKKELIDKKKTCKRSAPVDSNSEESVASNTPSCPIKVEI